jgi:NADPH:quinone reductase-like Zn-dependent oxidoreductase
MRLDVFVEIPWMRAIVYDPHALANWCFDDIDEPAVSASEALIQVQSIALNLGEIRSIGLIRNPGEVPGWDSAGIAVQAAAVIPVELGDTIIVQGNVIEVAQDLGYISVGDVNLGATLPAAGKLGSRSR